MPTVPAPATVPASCPTAVVWPRAPTSSMSSRREMVRTAARPIRPAAPATTTLCTCTGAHLFLDVPSQPRLLAKWADRRERQPVGHEEVLSQPPHVVPAHRVDIGDDLIQGDLASKILLRTGQFGHAA